MSAKDTKEIEDCSIMLSRVSNHLKMGIVGLPNVGKSTLYNILTKQQVSAENYPFCTIEPNKAHVIIPDSRLNFLKEVYKSSTIVNAYLEVVDIAGLVKGASEGEGLGNKFLSNIYAVDGIYHVCRIFDNEEVTHVEGDVNPIRDMEIIQNELLLKDLEIVEKKLEPARRLARADKTKRGELDILEKIYSHLESKTEIRYGKWNAKEIEVLRTLQLLTSKPVIYLVNMSENDFKNQKNKWLPKIKAWVEERSKDVIIPFSAALESKLATMSDEERENYCKENKVRSMIPRIIKQGFNALNLINFFTCGPKEVKAWTVHKGAKAPQAAGVIHGDFEKYFIKAEVLKYSDLQEYGSEANVKSQGKLLSQGKNYVVEDGDICLFRHNAGGAKK